MPEPFTANQLVAYNLMRARKMQGLSQEQAAELLEPYIGSRWSKAVYSAAERSFHGKRIRQFTADDLAAFSLAFGVPVDYFFVPPPVRDRPEEGVPGLLRFLDVIFGRTNRRAVLMRIGELPGEELPYPRRLQLIWTYSPPASVQLLEGTVNGRELIARFPEIMPETPEEWRADAVRELSNASGFPPEQISQLMDKAREKAQQREDAPAEDQGAESLRCSCRPAQPRFHLMPRSMISGSK